MGRARKLHYVFDTDCSGIMTRARFSGKKGSFEPSCEVNRNMLKSGVDPAILLHRYKSEFFSLRSVGCYCNDKGISLAL